MLTYIIAATVLMTVMQRNWLGVALSVLGGLYGASKDRKAAQRASDQAFQANQKQLRLGREALGKGAATATLWDDKSVSAIERAAARMRTIGVMQGQNIRNQLSVNMGNIQQGMANRGLGNTTLGANLQRGALSDYGQNMAQFSNGIMGQQAAAGGLLANAYSGYGQRRYGEAVDLAQSFFGQQYKAGATSSGSAAAYGKIGAALGGGMDDWWNSRGGLKDWQTGDDGMGPVYEG